MISRWFESESEVAQSCLTLCDPMDCSLLGSSLHGILQARTLEWVPFPSPGDLPDPGIEPGSPAFQADALTSELPGKPWWFESPITNLLNAYSLVWLRLLCPTPFTFSVWQAPWKIWKFHSGSLVRFLSTQTKQLELYQKSLWFFLEKQDWGQNSSKGCCTVVTKSTTTTKT